MSIHSTIKPSPEDSVYISCTSTSVNKIWWLAIVFSGFSGSSRNPCDTYIQCIPREHAKTLHTCFTITDIVCLALLYNSDPSHLFCKCLQLASRIFIWHITPVSRSFIIPFPKDLRHQPFVLCDIGSQSCKRVPHHQFWLIGD
jgi:hypothetical protein